MSVYNSVVIGVNSAGSSCHEVWARMNGKKALRDKTIFPAVLL